ILRCVTPAAVAGWVTAIERYGRLTFAQVAQPAFELADRGFAVDRSLSTALTFMEANARAWPSTYAVFFPNGRPPATGSVLKQPDLANTLRTLIRAEETSKGKTREQRLRSVRDAFYKGEIAQKIVAFAQKEGGFMTAEDLADFEAREEPPVMANYKGYEVYACGPWCQGPSVPQALKLLEGFDLQSMGHNTASYLHTIVEAIKLTFADRDRYYGDPDLVRVPMDALLSDAYAAVRRKLLDPSKAWPGVPPAGEPESRRATERVGGATMKVASMSADPGEPKGDTSYVCVVDSDGNGFSATPSDFIGQCPIVPGLGIIISGRGTQSWLDANHASSLQPGKRPRLTPNPGLVLRNGELFMTFGTPGGDQQPQGMVQAFLNVVEFGMTPQEAVEAPRAGSWSFPNSFWPHDMLPGRLNVEARVPATTLQRLVNLGHEVQLYNAYEPRLGHVCMVLRDPSNHVLHGGADPRFVSYAVGW
ncbi:MAG: gamma-glutamyltransferase, partial [Chloroflexi bacterium]|nr:gamma-glutamyltransferase [Chloroflexota bacterium]